MAQRTKPTVKEIKNCCFAISLQPTTPDKCRLIGPDMRKSITGWAASSRGFHLGAHPAIQMNGDNPAIIRVDVDKQRLWWS